MLASAGLALAVLLPNVKPGFFSSGFAAETAVLPNANVGFFTSAELEVKVGAAPKLATSGLDEAAAPNLKGATDADFDAGSPCDAALGREVTAAGREVVVAPNLKPPGAESELTFGS